MGGCMYVCMYVLVCLYVCEWVRICIKVNTQVPNDENIFLLCNKYLFIDIIFLHVNALYSVANKQNNMEPKG